MEDILLNSSDDESIEYQNKTAPIQVSKPPEIDDKSLEACFLEIDKILEENNAEENGLLNDTNKAPTKTLGKPTLQ